MRKPVERYLRRVPIAPDTKIWIEKWLKIPPSTPITASLGFTEIHAAFLLAAVRGVPDPNAPIRKLEQYTDSIHVYVPTGHYYSEEKVDELNHALYDIMIGQMTAVMVAQREFVKLSHPELFEHYRLKFGLDRSDAAIRKAMIRRDNYRKNDFKIK
jgi:hypothetical protein